jgi:hypothetical protein
MNRSRSLVVTAGLAVVCGLAAVGCQNDRNDEGGTVRSRTHDQTVRSDGTAVQTRTQIRDTPSGTTVRETQTQERQQISPSTRPSR